MNLSRENPFHERSGDARYPGNRSRSANRAGTTSSDANDDGSGNRTHDVEGTARNGSRKMVW